ncbi:MAG: hypothetical protein ACXWQQ_06945 [Pseudobdellovibrio sp.]
MEYLDIQSSWEANFTNELEALQQKMSSFDIESLSKSKLRLSLESKILDWKKYETWATETYGCSSIKEALPEATLKSYSINAQQAYALYANHGFWSQDLLPMFIWENQLIVFGLQYHPGLQKIPNHIFVLAPPRVLSYFANILLANKASMTEFDDLNEMFGDSNMSLDGLNNEAQPISIDFKNISADTVPATAARSRTSFKTKQNETEIWDLVNERYEEYVYESRKQFDAFLILKLNYDMTKIFKLDPDLEKQNINEKLFEYNTKQPNAFQQVVQSESPITINAAQLGLDFLTYAFISIAPIKRSNAVVGFFMAFKHKKPTPADVKLLEDLSKETVQAA